MGAELEPVMSYTDANCMRCGSCLQGCPTNAGKNSMNVYIHPPWAEGRLTLRAECTVTRVVIEDRGSGLEATGVEYVDAAGQAHTVERRRRRRGRRGHGQLAPAAALGHPRGGRRLGQLTADRPQHRLASGADHLRACSRSPRTRHRVYPISAHCMKFQNDADGGFIVEAATIQDPIGFSIMLCDEDGVPIWGRRLSETVRRYRYFSGLLAMVSDQNNGVPGSTRTAATGTPTSSTTSSASAIEALVAVRPRGAARRRREAGAALQPVQHPRAGRLPHGLRPRALVVDAHAESHDVRRLFLGDSSVIPTTMSVNPSLTIMSLASRLAAYLAGGEHGYFASGGRVSVSGAA